MEKKNLLGLTALEIYDLIRDEGFEYRHAVAITNSIYKKRISDLSLVAGIPKKLSSFLARDTEISFYEPSAREVSVDSTEKCLFRNREGNYFETVYLPEKKRNTVCVSTQSGCRMGCPFCATAGYGFHGNLDAGDMINQVLCLPYSERVTHVVFMGMGEPLDNLGNLLRACEILTAEWGLAISPRNITVSSVGITPAVSDFLGRSGCNFTISLYSPFPDERVKVVPAEKRYPVKSIIDIMKSFPVRKKRRLSVAYIMIRDINDTDRHLEALIELLQGSGIRVNLLPYHPLDDSGSASSDEGRMTRFRHNLMLSGISASVRKSRGADISAACGLLASGLR